ncbi:MAG TPA: hypothetical protein VF138_13160 [Caulobacteraceae bacterium]
MATFSPTDAALEGFRIAREKPRAMLLWAAVNFVVSLLVGVLMIAMFGPMLAELEAMSQAGSADPSEAMAVFERMAPLYAVMLPIGLLVLSVFTAAAYRAVLRPSDSRYGYLRLGRDEMRLILLMLIYVGLAIGFTFLLTLAAGLLAAGAAVAGGGIGALLGVIIGLVAIGLIVLVSVRLSLAGPMTFAEGRLRVFESWTLTRGNFWRLLGVYVLAIILVIVVFLLALIIYVALATVVAGGDIAAAGGVFQPDTTSVANYFTTAMVIYLVFAAFLSALQNAVLNAPPAVAYRELSGATREG